METTVERLDSNKVKLSVTVPAKDVEAAISKAYGQAAGKYRIPGFRKGKAPRPVIDNYVGRAVVMADALEEVVDSSYPKALSQENLRPIESPDLGELGELEPGQDYTYVAEVDIRPELTLSSTEGLKVEVSPSGASDEEVQAQIEYARERFATLESVEDRGVEPNDFVLLSFVGSIDGEPYEGNTVDKYLYEMGKGLMPTQFDEGLLGHGAGEHVTVEFTIPETSSVPEFVGKTARFEIDVHEIKAKVLPDLNDEYATNVGGFDTMDEYFKDVREKLAQAKFVSHMQETERAVRRALAERLEGDVPEPMIAERQQQMMRDFFRSLEDRGMTLEAYTHALKLTAADIERDVRQNAEESVREELALEALYRQLGMEITDEDIDEELAQLSGGAGEDARKFGENLRTAGAMPILMEQLMHKKAVRWLMEHAEIVEREPEAAGETAGEGEAAKAEAKPKKRARKSAKKDAEAAEQPAEKEE